MNGHAKCSRENTLSNHVSFQVFLKILTENSLAATLIGAAIIWAVKITWQRCTRWAQERRVISVLKSSADAGVYKFRTTEAIAAKAKLSEARVVDICSTHKLIHRNTGLKQSWRLQDEQ